MKKVVLIILGLLLVTFLVTMLLVPVWRDTLVGRVRGEPFYNDRPSSFWIKQLKDRDAGYRKEAIHNLRAMLDDQQKAPATAPDAIPDLIWVFRNDDDPYAREAALAALSHCRAYRDDLVPCGERLRRGLSPQSDRRENHRRAGFEIPWNIPALHPDLLCQLHPEMH